MPRGQLASAAKRNRAGRPSAGIPSWMPASPDRSAAQPPAIFAAGQGAGRTPTGREL